MYRMISGLAIVTTLLFSIFLDFSYASEISRGSADVIVSRTFPSSGIFPAAHEYVRYDVVIRNTGSSPISNESLWALFVSTGGKTNTFTSYSLEAIPPNASQTVHLGPFKMHEAGEHSLYLGINSKSNSSLPNEIEVGRNTNQAFDSFMVYDSQVLQVLIASVLAISIGIGSLTTFWYFKRKRKVRKIS